MKAILILFVALAITSRTGFAAASADSANSGKPNIVLIMVDDLGYGDISPYGQRKILTPNLGKIAERGMVFTQFYAGTSVCAPSRSSLMEGLHTGHTYIRGNKQNGSRNGQWPIPEDTVTMAKVLKKAGYATGMIGKWGLGNPGTTGDPLKQGWDYYFGYTDQVLAHNYYPEYLLKNGEKIKLNNKVKYLEGKFDGLGSYSTERNEYSHDYFMSEALNFIESNQDHPFFLYLPFTIPHDNGEQLESMKFEVPRQGIYAEKDSWTKNQQDYAAMISYMDVGLGDIYRRLKNLGILNNTLLIFTSDNGPMKNIPTTAFFNSNGDLRGAKRDVYEGGIRVPMIAHWPGVVTGGRVSDHVSAAWDFMPTFCEMAGVAAPDNTDGISLLPELKGEKQPEHPFLYWEYHTKGGNQAVRMGDWKGVRMNGGADKNAHIELYNLATDIGETKDVAPKHTNVVKQIREIMDTEHSPSELFPFAYERN